MALRQKALMSSNAWTVQLPDEEGVQTRLNEIETISLVLCNRIDKLQADFIDGNSMLTAKGKFRLPLAQVIHKNLVKVPDYCFETIQPCSAFTDYLFGKHSVGIVADDGTVSVNGLKEKYRLLYSHEMGLVIEKKAAKEEI